MVAIVAFRNSAFCLSVFSRFSPPASTIVSTGPIQKDPRAVGDHRGRIGIPSIQLHNGTGPADHKTFRREILRKKYAIGPHGGGHA